MMQRIDMSKCIDETEDARRLETDRFISLEDADILFLCFVFVVTGCGCVKDHTSSTGQSA